MNVFIARIDPRAGGTRTRTSAPGIAHVVEPCSAPRGAHRGAKEPWISFGVGRSFKMRVAPHQQHFASDRSW